jgi:hypothetical protein
MDSHFSKILAPNLVAQSGGVPSVTFIEADRFQGRKPGYKFTRGSKGLGYYYDRVQSFATSTAVNGTEVSMLYVLSLFDLAGDVFGVSDLFLSGSAAERRRIQQQTKKRFR